MLSTTPADRVALAPPTRSRLTYFYLLRIPIVSGAIFLLLPYLATRTTASSLLGGLFDVGGVGVWILSTTAFVLSLTIMTSAFLVLTYADSRCNVVEIKVDYPIRPVWYIVFGLLAIPTLVGAYSVSSVPLTSFLGWCLLGCATANFLYEVPRRLGGRIEFLQAGAKVFARFPELSAGYVDSEKMVFLPGHRFAFNFGVLLAVLYVVIGRQMSDPNNLALPTLAYALLLLIILCWVLSGLAFFLDRYRVPTMLPVALLIVGTGFQGGSDHYFQLKHSWYSDPVSPVSALTAHPPGTPERKSAIVVAANGGGIQAAAWTARVLTGLEQTCRATSNDRCHFAESIRLISSVSGGSVGAMYVADAFSNGKLPSNDALDLTVARAERSSLEHVGWGLLYRDLFRPLYPHFDYGDRGSALEDAWQRDIDLSAPLESWREDVAAGLRPATIFNATISDSGERLLIGTANPPEAPGRRNFERVFDWADVSIVTAARLSAAFTYVSPAARADNDEEASIHFVDGGYYDVYGVASLVDWLDDALRANQRSEGVKIDRVMVLQLRGAPPGRETQGKRRGWFYQAYAPLSALLGARDTGQLAHNDEEISLLRRAWAGKVAISSAVFQFCGGLPPLSWHMTDGQREAIEQEWREEQIGAGARAVMSFLTAGEPGPYPPAAVPMPTSPRCTPAPIEAESRE
jgi:hypothetical protein